MGMKNLEKTWRDFSAKPFPEGCTGVDIDGIDPVELDTFAAGCIQTFVGENGHLDAERTSILKKCANELDAIVPTLEGEALDYFSELQLLSYEVLRVASRSLGEH